VQDFKLAFALQHAGSIAANRAHHIAFASRKPFKSPWVNPAPSLAACQVTLVRPNRAPGPPAIDVEGEAHQDGTGTASLAVVDSIVRGFSTTYVREGQAGGGAANLLIAYSNIALSGINSGPGTLDVNHENFAADPHFAGPGDYHLLAASPSIDRADPDATAGATDLDGAPRLRDGNGDGIARRDQGAYEFQPPTPTNPAGGDTPTDGTAAPAGNAPATPAQPAPDTTPPSLGPLHIR
jgi:hypothetical protein